MFRLAKKYILCLLLFSFSSLLFSKDYIIFSISQDVPMGFDNEVIKKNFYVNIGSNQGIEKGATLDVFRVISRIDPYDTKTRYNYKVKVGELQVLHSEENAAIGQLKALNTEGENPYFEIKNLMIGDKVSVHVKD